MKSLPLLRILTLGALQYSERLSTLLGRKNAVKWVLRAHFEEKKTEDQRKLNNFLKASQGGNHKPHVTILIATNENKIFRDFPDDPVAYSVLPVLEAGVCSLVWELTSHNLHGAASVL